MKIKWTILIVMLLAVLNAAASDYLVVVNSGAGVTALDKDSLQKIFLGKQKKWDGGNKIVLATLKTGDANDLFLDTVVGKSPSQFSTHWKRLVFTGKAKAPESFNDSSELVSFVAETPGAIGYIDADTAYAGVTVVSVD